ncbi:alpha/beta hydrolase [Demequina sp. TTPB684]|uniref:alpha/beta fold hydrolase n=1 Tax=unclassified Demequina TaxID=2620311 RepID=UPI001CF5D21D|nr:MULTISPECIES: alpha/beta hydrolase [unclassified Demequina]MCB2413995.1 alpha/beta hydrolase [Demequina sp. TTPB684]UPU88653.1 alpha/beta hydrolase [Demequina sp. TMPB413]
MSLLPTGTPLVLLNAFPLDREQWEPLIAALDTWEGDIITFDPPGIGDMPPSSSDPSLNLIADAAVSAMREVTGSRDAIWVGCSMGGYVAMAVLERHADAVAGLGLIGTRATADTAEARERRLTAAEKAEEADGVADPRANVEGLVGARTRADDALSESLVANVARQAGVGVAWNQRAMAARPDRTAVLAACDAPAFVARGHDDGLTTQQEAEQMAAALGVDVTVVEGAGHVAHVERPEVIARLIDQLASA